MRRLALLLPLLVLTTFVSGCDSGPDEVGTVTITRVSLLQIPFPAPNEQGWDDVFLRFKVNGVTVRTTRDDARRVEPSDLGDNIDIGGDLDLRDLSYGLVIEVVNREGSVAQDVVIGTTQPLSLQNLADSEPSAQIVQSSDGLTRLNLSFQYD